MTSGWFEQLADIRDIKVITVVISLFFAFGIILLGLLNNVLIITPLLFYIPIIVAAYWFPKKAVLFAISIGAANILIVYIYSYPNNVGLAYTMATASFYILVALALIISSLTQNMKIKEARYHGIFDYSDTGIFLAAVRDDDFIVSEVNSKGLTILGYKADEIAGRPLSVVMPAFIARHAVIDQIRKNGRLMITESLLDRKDSTTVPVLIAGVQMPDGMIIFTMTDISERKKAEELLQRSLREKEILLQEVHHRVKNNMQVISGLIELQSAQIKDPDTRRIFQESYNRIKTMALIHESLYRSEDMARIDFSTYLNDLVSYLLTSYGRSRDEILVDINLTVAHMSMDLAVPCGLIANELLSNSLHHAFPGGRRGVITIRLEHVPGTGYELIVSDDGVGLPEGMDFRHATTFGLQMINGLAEHQMRGTVQHRKGTGTTFIIRFPDSG